jgi:hypothetical protein
MRRQMYILIVTLFTFALPLVGAAAEMHEHDKTESMEYKTEHDAIPGTEHGELAEMMRGMLILGEQTVDGVKAMAHLKDVKAAMAKMGRKETHHFMVAFVDTATGRQISSGSAVLRIESPSGQEGEAVRLMAMEGYFGADITLAEKGVYTITLGTKVGGEKRRQFEFKHEIKQEPARRQP